MREQEADGVQPDREGAGDIREEDHRQEQPAASQESKNEAEKRGPEELRGQEDKRRKTMGTEAKKRSREISENMENKKPRDEEIQDDQG